ncbi:hypothetical protein H839_02701 [Parageobacillus genomosp. 1]|uniref:DUF418 domain-containing protein n=1 Tax=Parageobacillus genomosp. 1 TaxID=1295642 RepID=A0ABC9VIQ1_9BACL|nr:DUF418 domain-containing protein [Parageobacillus genomosp. 1]EZP78742.1 hypothetical protein H839_02701 [Parageobacillus genomosp. 1]
MSQPSSEQRIIVIDVLRGFALLGILLVNMPHFSSPVLYDRKEFNGLDRWTAVIVDIACEASFYPLFAFLFGFSMVLFRHRLQQRHLPFEFILVRRLIALLAIGVVHAFGIWFGDILIPYALAGAILLLFFKTRPRVWLIGAMICFFIPHLLMLLLLGMTVFSGKEGSGEDQDVQLAAEAIDHYQNGSLSDIFWQRWNDWMYVNGSGGLLFTVMTVLPLCLIGGYVAQKRWIEEAERHTAVFRHVALLSLIAGLFLKTLPYFTVNNGFTMYIQNIFGGTSLACFYGTAIVLLFQKRRWKQQLIVFQYIGKMSLTNYLLQSLCCTLLFYHYGFGWYGKMGMFAGALLSLFLYSAQLVISRKWLRHFHFGPAEWVWRWVTYGKKPPLYKQKSPS